MWDKQNCLGVHMSFLEAKNAPTFNMLRKMTQKFRNYKSCKFNINLIILHNSSQEEHLVCWSWLQSWCLQGERAQVRILAATFFFNFSLFHDRFNQPMIQPVFWVEPWFVQFSQNHVYLVLIVKKHQIYYWFTINPVGLASSVRV